ncbi:nicotinamide N-methyltransferase-like [Lissotriton helveticus]
MESVSNLSELQEAHLDPKKLLETFFLQESEFHEDSIQRIFDLLNRAYSPGSVKGKTLIQMSVAPLFQYLFLASEYFKEIIIGGSTDKCISEIEKWRTNAPGAIDCSHAAKLTCDLQGNRDAWTEKQNMLREKIIHVLKYDVCKSNPFSPTVLPLADCLFLKHCLEYHVTEKDGFCNAVNNVSSLLKKGGYLILMACLEQTYCMVGSFKLPNLSIDVDFVINTLEGCGYDVQDQEVMRRSVDRLYDVTDYKGVIYVKAQKK